jgi:radical SAM superfamily enzyme YgiQ (UPF0313 family)
MKILIVAPNLRNEINFDYQFPIGLAYISAILKANNYKVITFNSNHYSFDVFIDKLKNYNYDIIMTGGMWMHYKPIKKIIDETRKYSKAKIIIGGSIVSSEPHMALELLNPDYAVIGEGEETILELLKYIKNKENKKPSTIKGIAYMENGKIKITSKREFVNLNELPYPDFDGFEFEEYLNNMYSNQWYYNNLSDNPRAYSLLGSRGCPFHCTFCYQALGKKYRVRKIENIIKEMEWAIEKYKINIFNILDDTFIAGERITEFCNAMIDLRKKYEVSWVCQMSVVGLNKETLCLLKKAGCFLISYGFESYSKKILASMKKPITPEQIDFALKETLKQGIAIQGNFIFGDPAETLETINETINYWTTCEGQINLYFIQPCPGSEIWDYCLNNKLIDKKNYLENNIGRFNLINMTKINQWENICRNIILLSNMGFIKHSIPKQILPSSKNFKIEVDCPYCNKLNKYSNIRLPKEIIWKFKMICKNCAKRYYVLSPIFQEMQTGD